MKDHRKLTTVLTVNQAALARFAIPFFVLFLFCVIGLRIQIWYFLNQMQSRLPLSVGPAQEAEAWMYLNNTITNVAVASMIFGGVLTFVLWLVYSHRIFGPMVPIRRHIKQLSEGNYESQITLRKFDEFKDVADDLNQLAQTLKQKRS